MLEEYGGVKGDLPIVTHIAYMRILLGQHSADFPLQKPAGRHSASRMSTTPKLKNIEPPMMVYMMILRVLVLLIRRINRHMDTFNKAIDEKWNSWPHQPYMLMLM